MEAHVLQNGVNLFFYTIIALFSSPGLMSGEPHRTPGVGVGDSVCVHKNINLAYNS